DYLQRDPERDLAFVSDAGGAFLEAYLPIARRRRGQPWGEAERAFQLLRRGRYIEFNLLYDRGTVFGLKTDGRTESILMSLPRRARHVRDYYRRIGGRSPIADITAEQARRLEERLNAGRPGAFRCYVAMRYWRPFTADALARMHEDRVSRLVALTLYPHYTTA